MSYEITYWQNCYDLNWKGIITDAAFAHPAKFSHGLIRRIYQHALAAGHVQPGAVVLDPFGGVALGALYAMQNGLNWVGCELEEKFVSLGRENIALWNARYAESLPAWGSATLLQGDSRRLASVVAGAGLVPLQGPARLVVGSPPYADSLERPNGIDASKIKRPGGNGSQSVTDPRYGSTPGQLGTDSGPTFWHAAAEIMAQCALLLPPGGYAYWVVKAYVKKGEIVDFPGQWAALAEAYGFEVVETVRAWLVKDHGTQADLFGGNGHKKSVARKSFFRRLAEAKGSPAIDWETVLITRRRND